MLLAIDAGNTNLTLATCEEGDPSRLGPLRRAASRPDVTVDELELLLEGLLALDSHTLADVDRLAIASVVPAYSEALATIAQRRRLNCLAASAATVPIPVRVRPPSAAGADRLVNAFAAGRLYGRPAIVLDFGTATTLDVVASDGAYIGGAIAPGLELGLDALAAHTAALPRIDLRAPDRAIGDDTVSAMQSGSVLGYLGLAQALLDRTREELGAGGDPDAPPPVAPKVIVTGGLANASWVEGLRGVDAIDPELTLRGLVLLAAA
ncbi:MAG TPA: type III pantothenate kinase [Candidatus Limnocylindrales bacterium]|nr:type III pantothenate kinase [Candidatus Limnocylindrales bacterium]